MDNRVFTNPILNSPYTEPLEQWELKEDGLPTQRVLPGRRPVRFVTPISNPKKQSSKQIVLALHDCMSSRLRISGSSPVPSLSSGHK